MTCNQTLLSMLPLGLARTRRICLAGSATTCGTALQLSLLLSLIPCQLHVSCSWCSSQFVSRKLHNKVSVCSDALFHETYDPRHHLSFRSC